MSLLAYCIAETGSNVELPPRGIQGAFVRTLSDAGLTCFFSEYDPSAQPDNYAREAALDFNRVLQDLLRQMAIVPFRFPTSLADEPEISNFLQQHAAEYRDVLLRLRDVVQIEINLTAKNPPQPEGSGRAYLLARQQLNQTLADTAEQIRLQLGKHIQDWRQHQSSNATRCYMLVWRRDLKGTFETCRELKIPPELRARITGPWPATEFISLPPEEQENSLQSSRSPVTTKAYG
jgi:Gas vesicle synthesis protein GvpL/GvpF